MKDIFLEDMAEDEEKNRLELLKRYNFFSVDLNEKILRSCFHDLKNLICGISMFAELLAIHSRDEKCQKIVKTAWKTQEIIKSLQNYVFCYDVVRPYDVNTYIENFFYLLPHVKEFGNIKCSLKLSPDLPDVMGNKYLFQQALCSLSSQLCEKGETSVFTRLEKETSVVVVSFYFSGWNDFLLEFKDSLEYAFCMEVADLHKGKFEVKEKEAIFSFPACISS